MKPLTLSSKILSYFPLFLVLYEITNYLANDMYLPALPQIAADLHTTTQLAQQTLTVWFFGTASLQLWIGPLSDRYGRKPIFFIGGLIFMASTLFCILATDVHSLLIARFFQGCAVCFILTAGYSSIHELYSHTRAIQILAIMGSITVIAPAFGPLLGSLILHWFHWQGIFILLLIWAGIALLALWFFMPESNPKEKRHPLDWQTLYGHYVAILRNPTFMYNTLIFCCTFISMIAWIAVGPFLVITKFHFSPFIFGCFQVMIFGSLILGTQFVKRYVERVGAKKLIQWGLRMALFSGTLAFSLTWLFPKFLPGLIMSLMLFTFAASLINNPTHRIAIEACTEPMGIRMAVFSSIMSLSGFVGGLLVGLTDNGTLLWLGVFLLVSGLIAAILYGLIEKGKI